SVPVDRRTTGRAAHLRDLERPERSGKLPTSERPTEHACEVGRGHRVGLAGIEPATSSLSGMRSNRLSYSPAWAVADGSKGGKGEATRWVGACEGVSPTRARAR